MTCGSHSFWGSGLTCSSMNSLLQYAEKLLWSRIPQTPSAHSTVPCHHWLYFLNSFTLLGVSSLWIPLMMYKVAPWPDCLVTYTFCLLLKPKHVRTLERDSGVGWKSLDIFVHLLNMVTLTTYPALDLRPRLRSNDHLSFSSFHLQCFFSWLIWG